MHMKSDALKRLYPRCKKKKVRKKEMNINQQTGLETVLFLSTHIPQGLNSGAEARRKKKKEKSANEMTI